MAEPILSPPRAPASANQSLMVGVTLIVVIGALYVGAGIFVPLVLAVLLAFALAPVVRNLRKLHLPQIAAVVLAVLLAIVILSSLAYLIFSQLISLTSEIPRYQATVIEKIRGLQQSMPGGGVFERFANGLQSLGGQASATATSLDEAVRTSTPIPVTIENGAQSPFTVAQGFLGSLLGPLATAAIVTVFVIFLLLQREDLRDRFLKLVSRGDLQTSTKVMNEAAKRVSRYLLVQFTVNLTYGIIFSTGLFFIGIPNAILWGLFAAMFRYIPFVGTLIAASIPFSLAFAVDPGWSMLIWSIALFATLELVTTNAIEPRLYGSSTGLSPLAVMIAAIFWATLWGPIGLILATPMTVCLVVIGRYVPQLRFLEILLGSEPVLDVDERLYQRLLAGNTEEAIELAESYLAEHSAQEFYDGVAVPALRLAEADRLRDGTELTHRRLIVEGMSGVVREVDHLTENESATLDRDPALPDAEPTILCIGGRTELDGAAAEIIAHLVRRPTLDARVLPPIAVRQEGVGQIDVDGIEIVCLAYLGDNPRSYARFVSRRLKRRSPDIKIVVCLLNPSLISDGDDLLAQYEADAVVYSVTSAEAQILAWTATSAVDVEPASGQAETIEKLKSISTRTHHFDEFAAQVAAGMKVPMALISTIDSAADVVPASLGTVTKSSDAGTGLRELRDTIITGGTLVIEDLNKTPQFAENPFLLENGAHFFAGVPMSSSSGEAIGALCIFDGDAREFADTDRVLLQKFADQLMADLEQTDADTIAADRVRQEMA